MNQKSLISMGLVLAFSAALVPAFAADDNKIIYTDNLGRMHFLGRNASSNEGTKYNYTNPAEQELTRKLYSEDRKLNYDGNFDQHPVKNYENTFPDSRFTTKTFWNKNYVNDTDAAKVNAADVKNVDPNAEIPTSVSRPGKTPKKTSVSAAQGSRYGANPYAETANQSKVNLKEESVNVIKEEKTAKKHWWNKK